VLSGAGGLGTGDFPRRNRPAARPPALLFNMVR
jgi:hypothetical protein